MTQQMVPIGSLDIDPMVKESEVYKRLRALNLPHEFAHEIGRLDIMMGLAVQSVVAQTAKAIDTKVAEVRLDSFLDDQRQDRNTARGIVAGAMFTTAINAPQATQQALPAPSAPSAPSAPTLTRIFTIQAASVGSVAVGDPIGLSAAGEAIVADANQYLGPALAVSGNQVVVQLTAPIVHVDATMTPGQVYYMQTPGNPRQLFLYADLTVGSACRGRYFAVGAHEGMALSWEPFEKSP